MAFPPFSFLGHAPCFSFQSDFTPLIVLTFFLIYFYYILFADYSDFFFCPFSAWLFRRVCMWCSIGSTSEAVPPCFLGGPFPPVPTYISWYLDSLNVPYYFKVVLVEVFRCHIRNQRIWFRGYVSWQDFHRQSIKSTAPSSAETHSWARQSLLSTHMRTIFDWCK